ncbi:MAG TPA: hypothetical protein DCW68_05345 [Rhodospirillaceae bacterium]|nr:MAG: hypothetical protein A2018_02305 [Alphaproteobacteria bacterium GWF2_58_20]HAU29520.1 hypothetical protein [Rhodospirillaceae bacterium]
MAKMKVLIVDDDELNTIIVETYLTDIQDIAFETIIFTNSLEAAAWLENNQPDLMLVDYMMPDLDGMELIRRFRKDPANDDVPAVIITSSEEERLRSQALQAGANDFLTKPVDATELAARSRTLLRLRQATLDLKSLQAQQVNLNEIDSLTKLLSRRTFLEKGQKDIEQQAPDANGQMVAILMDIDGLRQLNYTYGFPGGDAALRTIATRIHETESETGGYAGRIDGQQFVIILPSASAEIALAAAEKLRTAIESSRIDIYGQNASMTASFGISVAHDGDHWLHSLLERAEKALRQAKEQGRNCIVTFP